MLLKVKPLNSEIISIEIDENSKIEDLEDKILDLTGIPADTYRLVYKGRILKKESIINELNINGTIFMVKTSVYLIIYFIIIINRNQKMPNLKMKVYHHLIQ